MPTFSPQFSSPTPADRRSADTRSPSVRSSLYGSSFESQYHRDEVLRCIAAGVLPLKYAYAGSAAHTHDLLAHSEGYHRVIGSIRHEAEAIHRTWATGIVPRQIVEIGPGNGVHTVALLGELARMGSTCDRFLAMDFSTTLLSIARARIGATVGRTTQVTSAVWDVEDMPTPRIGRWRSGSAPLVAALLGQTLGNVENPTKTLININTSLRAGDFLIAALTLWPNGADEDDVVAPYRSALFRRAALEPLRAAGVELDDVEMELHFADGAVIGEAVFRHEGMLDSLTVPRGHRVRCFVSRRFSRDDLGMLFDRSGLAVDSAVLDDTGEHVAVVATRMAVAKSESRRTVG